MNDPSCYSCYKPGDKLRHCDYDIIKERLNRLRDNDV